MPFVFPIRGQAAQDGVGPLGGTGGKPRERRFCESWHASPAAPRQQRHNSNPNGGGVGLVCSSFLRAGGHQRGPAAGVGRCGQRPGQACARGAGRAGRPQARAPAGAGWQGVGGCGQVGLLEKWLYYSYTLLAPPRRRRPPQHRPPAAAPLCARLLRATQSAAAASPEPPRARRSTALAGAGWCWTGAAGWGRGARRDALE